MSTTIHTAAASYLVLGGARSGKSGYAERLAAQAAEPSKHVVYIATATIHDQEMQQRVARHQQDRPEHWQTLEEPLALAETLRQQCADNTVVLVDCLTLWLSNLLMQDNTDVFKQETEKLYALVPHLRGTVIFVSNEVGMGIVPMGELSRTFVDESGWLHQKLAQQLSNVVFMVAGLPMALKGNLPKV